MQFPGSGCLGSLAVGRFSEGFVVAGEGFGLAREAVLLLRRVGGLSRVR